MVGVVRWADAGKAATELVKSLGARSVSGFSAMWRRIGHAFAI